MNGGIMDAYPPIWNWRGWAKDHLTCYPKGLFTALFPTDQALTCPFSQICRTTPSNTSDGGFQSSGQWPYEPPCRTLSFSRIQEQLCCTLLIFILYVSAHNCREHLFQWREDSNHASAEWLCTKLYWQITNRKLNENMNKKLNKI